MTIEAGKTATDKAREAAAPVSAVNRIFPKATAFYYCLALYVARDKRTFLATRDELKNITGIADGSLNSKLITKCLNVLCDAKWLRRRVKTKTIPGENGAPPQIIRKLVITFLIRRRRPDAFRPSNVGRGHAMRLLRRRICRDVYYKELIKGHEDLRDKVYLKGFLSWLVKAKEIPIPDIRSVFGGPALVWADERLHGFRLKFMLDEQANDMIIALEKKDGRDWVPKYFFLGLGDALKLKAAEVEAALAKVLHGEDYQDIEGVPFCRWESEPVLPAALPPRRAAAPKAEQPRFIEEPANL